MKQPTGVVSIVVCVLGVLVGRGDSSAAAWPQDGPENLDQALTRAIDSDEHIGQLLAGVPDRVIQSPETAARLIKYLDSLTLEEALRKSEEVSQLDVVIALFQNAHNGQAITLLRSEGLPYLYRLSDQLSQDIPEEAQDEFLYLMQLFAGYQTREGSQRVVKAAKQGLLADHPLWPFVFDAFTIDNNDTVRVLNELTQPLPKGEIAIGVLDCANAVMLEGTELKHPFDQDAGIERILAWLKSDKPEDLSRAQSATAAIPFLKHPKRNTALQAAVDHSHPLIKAESGWALAMLGDRRGLRLLQAVASDVRYSSTAQLYLEELGEEDLIPQEARDPNFVARATMCQFLSHPAERGAPPETAEVLDSRVVRWPPSRDQRQVWLIKVKYPAADGAEAIEAVGIVGSLPAFQPEFALATRSLDELYGYYCAWELKTNNDPRAPEELTWEAGLKLLKEANPDWDSQ